MQAAQGVAGPGCVTRWGTASIYREGCGDTRGAQAAGTSSKPKRTKLSVQLPRRGRVRVNVLQDMLRLKVCRKRVRHLIDEVSQGLDSACDA